MDIGNYAQHARIWEWGGYDNTPEYEYWCEYAKNYGKNILTPMSALGETGAYMAQHGFHVTALDITREMVEEGNKRFGNVENFALMYGDIRDFSFDIPPVDFAFVKDLMHLHTIDDIKSAFLSIARHMRDGAGLVIETGLPIQESEYFPRQAFYPIRQVYPGMNVWKTGETRNDAQEKRTYISQTVYIEDESGVTEFDHSFYMQWYEREEWIAALKECGFGIKAEYRNREKEPWRPGDYFWIVEAVKVDDKAARYSPHGSFKFFPADNLTHEEAQLVCKERRQGNKEIGTAPSYLFDIVVNGNPVGGVHLRVGYTLAYYFAGQIGYWIDERFRGHSYAAKGCIALIPLLKAHGFEKILISTDGGNTASQRICEKIGARLIETLDTPEWSGLYDEGQRQTSIYEWDITLCDLEGSK